MKNEIVLKYIEENFAACRQAHIKHEMNCFFDDYNHLSSADFQIQMNESLDFSSIDVDFIYNMYHEVFSFSELKEFIDEARKL